MRAVWIAGLSLLSSTAGAEAVIVNRVPEPDMWALIGVVVVALGVSRFIGRQ